MLKNISENSLTEYDKYIIVQSYDKSNNVFNDNCRKKKIIE